jgi:hypothetical protein
MGPTTGCGTYGSSSDVTSSGVNLIESAGTASSRCDIFVAPIIGAVTGCFCSTQASAIWARGTPRFSAIVATCFAINQSVSAVASYLDL